MNDKKRARNCERCNLRKSQEAYLGRVFNYENCPFVCLENKIDNVGSGIIRNPRPRIILAK